MRNSGTDEDESEFEDRWPHIDDEALFGLWLKHTPHFLRLDDPWQESLKIIRIPFLIWLESRGIELGTSEVANRTPQVEAVAPGVRRGPRIKLEGVEYRQKGNSAEAMVAVSLLGKTVDATSRSEIAANRVIWLPAEALLKATRNLLPVIEFEIENAFTIGSRESVRDDIAIVIARDPERIVPNRFVGACEISTSEPEAGAKAALAAINRHAEIAAGFYRPGVSESPQ